jgi:hypothetical protein
MDQGLARARLTEAVAAWLARCARGEAEPFVWGRTDCVLHPANLHVAAGLPDPVPNYRGRYRSLLGAYRLMEGDLERQLARAAKRLRWQELSAAGAGVDRSFGAQCGDIGLIRFAVPMRHKLGRTGPEIFGHAEVKFCVIRGPHGDWHGPIDRGASCYPDRDIIRAYNVLPGA